MKSLILAVAFCLIAATAQARVYTCGDLTKALADNDNYVLVNSAHDATVYLRTYWPQLASDPDAMQASSEMTIQVCAAETKDHQGSIPIQKVLEAVAIHMEGSY